MEWITPETWQYTINLTVGWTLNLAGLALLLCKSWTEFGEPQIAR